MRAFHLRPEALVGALLLLSCGGGAVRAVQAAQRGTGDEARILEANQPRLAERAGIGGEPIRYKLLGLQRGKGYEVRVSFPGTYAVRVRLWLDSAGGGGGRVARAGVGSRRELRLGSGSSSGGSRGSSRKLLDAEKIMFSTDGEGRVWLDGEGRAFSSVEVMFRAEPWGRWRRQQQAPQELVYDIVLEPSTLGVPHSSLPLLVTAVVVLLLAAAAVPWWAGKAVPAILRWLHGETTLVAAAAAAVASPRPRRTPLMAS